MCAVGGVLEVEAGVLRRHWSPCKGNLKRSFQGRRYISAKPCGDCACVSKEQQRGTEVTVG